MIVRLWRAHGGARIKDSFVVVETFLLLGGTRRPNRDAPPCETITIPIATASSRHTNLPKWYSRDCQLWQLP